MVLPCEGQAPTMWILAVTPAQLQVGTAPRLIVPIRTPSLSRRLDPGLTRRLAVTVQSLVVDYFVVLTRAWDAQVPLALVATMAMIATMD